FSGSPHATLRFPKLLVAGAKPRRVLPRAEQSPRVSNRWRSSGGVETNELPLAPRDATQTRVSALKGEPTGRDFTNFHAGCHGPVPLESVISSEDAATHSAISPVHPMGCAITEAGSCA